MTSINWSCAALMTTQAWPMRPSRDPQFDKPGLRHRDPQNPPCQLHFTPLFWGTSPGYQKCSQSAVGHRDITGSVPTYITQQHGQQKCNVSPPPISAVYSLHEQAVNELQHQPSCLVAPTSTRFVIISLNSWKKLLQSSGHFKAMHC
jgi:hypothetical protein